MIQLIRDSDTLITNNTYLNLKRYLSADFDTSNGFLMNLKSRLTKRDYYFQPAFSTIESLYNDRYVMLAIFVSPFVSIPLSSIMQVGTPERPLGFYDAFIYQNIGGTNTNPDAEGVKLLFTGLCNITGAANSQSVSYKEYTPSTFTNENVYLTID
tara:strand:+ start:158 stop:622 length:465 start_codon:yes stop_codon:yes gene_type:complete